MKTLPGYLLGFALAGVLLMATLGDFHRVSLSFPPMNLFLPLL